MPDPAPPARPRGSPGLPAHLWPRYLAGRLTDRRPGRPPAVPACSRSHETPAESHRAQKAALHGREMKVIVCHPYRLVKLASNLTGRCTQSYGGLDDFGEPGRRTAGPQGRERCAQDRSSMASSYPRGVTALAPYPESPVLDLRGRRDEVSGLPGHRVLAARRAAAAPDRSGYRSGGHRWSQFPARSLRKGWRSEVSRCTS